MVSGPDDREPGEEPDEDLDTELSAKAKAIKKQIAEGRYQVDIGALASSLLDDGVLDEELEDVPPDPAQNDQRPKKP